MDACDPSEGHLMLKSAFVSGLGWVEGEDTILGKMEPLQQNGNCAFESNRWACAQAEMPEYDKGVEKHKW